MADIKVLMVLDGARMNFGPQQPMNDLDPDYFGVHTLVTALANSTSPTIQVDMAHRRGFTFQGKGTDADNNVHEDCSAGLLAPFYGKDFVFAQTSPPGPNTVTVDLMQYDVLWLIADEGLMASTPGNTALGTTKDAPLSGDEKIAIANFMDSQGGVFAVGDHDGIGSMMCGDLLRVRTMRRWWAWNQNPPYDPGNGQSFQTNWNAYGLDPSHPAQPDRNDTLQPDSYDSLYYFNDQSDAKPQQLLTASGTLLTGAQGAVHPLLRDSQGAVIGNFPDHMHEGEATDFTTISATASPFNPNDGQNAPFEVPYQDHLGNTQKFPEFWSVNGFQPAPEVIAYDADSGHSTYYDFSASGPAYGMTQKKSRGAVSVYDGRAVGRGRVITGTTFHHYIDKNLVGDPMTAATGMPQHGPTGSNTGLAAATVQSITDYYVNAVSWLARPNNNFQIWTVKSTFGAAESLTAGNAFSNAFYLVLEGFAPSVVGANPTIAFSGPFAALNIGFNPTLPPMPDDPGSPNAAQRILIPVDITSIPPNAFPNAGSAPKVLALEVRITFGNQTLDAEALFELTSAADPYFANVAGSPPNPFYLSQDLRVFQFTPPFQPAPFVAFPGDGYSYMKSLLQYLNDPTNGYTDGSKDPVTQLNAMGYLAETSSVTPTNPMFPGAPNYAFAIARVRLTSASNATAPNVNVFFRLFTTASNDTDYDPLTTYLSSLDNQGLPGSPKIGVQNTTFPMTASGAVSTDYFTPGQPGYPGPNQHDIAVSANATSWRYFGCYLDVYSNNSPIPAGGHHCLVAQIAYDLAPIFNSNGLTLSPENSDKLAQRNIVFTASGNPGGAAAHRIPQTFDLRTSVRATAEPAGSLAGHPDELMIDWGEVPLGSTASIYWPGAAAIEVARLANLLYAKHTLTVADANTVRCEVTSRLSFVPIPFGSGEKLAGLLTIDLPAGRVHAGQKFDVVVRRVSTRQVPAPPAPPQIRSRRTRAALNTRAIGEAKRVAAAAAAAAAAIAPASVSWRYVVGTFQVTIPVALEETLLWPEENVLSIMKWRLEQWPTNDRWYPVLLRYIEYLNGRVEGFGGNPGKVPPSRTGIPAPHGRGRGNGHDHHDHEYTGKICEVFFDRFGDFTGFVLDTCDGHREFHSHEREIGALAVRACHERLLLSVFADHRHDHRIDRMIVRE